MLAHYGADSEIDTIFYVFYIMMLVAAFTLNPAKLQSPMLVAILVCMVGLSRWRAAAHTRG
jgi:hypothetical protein